MLLNLFERPFTDNTTEGGQRLQDRSDFFDIFPGPGKRKGVPVFPGLPVCGGFATSPQSLLPIVPVTCKTVAQSHVSWPHQKNKIWMRRAGPKFYPGAHPRSAPYPCTHFPLSLFPSHTPSPSPRTLAQNPHPAPGAYPGASTFASHSGANTAVSTGFCNNPDADR